MTGRKGSTTLVAKSEMYARVLDSFFLGSVCAGQDGDKADIRAITPEKIHGPMDVPYVLLCDLVCVCT